MFARFRISIASLCPQLQHESISFRSLSQIPRPSRKCGKKSHMLPKETTELPSAGSSNRRGPLLFSSQPTIQETSRKSWDKSILLEADNTIIGTNISQSRPRIIPGPRVDNNENPIVTISMSGKKIPSPSNPSLQEDEITRGI